MKRVLILLIGFLLTGCVSSGSAATENPAEKSVPVTVETVQNGEANESGSVNTEEDIDYDLTVMGSDMIYATVYQMMIDPISYAGKKFKVKGNYYSAYSEGEEKYYHFCMIKDAAACCAQGLELLWQDEDMNMHENCPAEDELITIEGTFETYRDAEGKNLYGRLKDVVIVSE